MKAATGTYPRRFQIPLTFSKLDQVESTWCLRGGLCYDCALHIHFSLFYFQFLDLNHVDYLTIR
jgi:hypothetical protein